MKNDPARNKKARPNLITVLGSIFFFANPIHIKLIINAKMITKNEFAELLTPLGSSFTTPNKVLSKFLAAKRLNDPPDCSKNAQNKIENIINIKAAMSFLRSAQLYCVISKNKYSNVAGPIMYINQSVY
ncbi:hypothetical protein D3C80_1477850 [compost metagenome]